MNEHDVIIIGGGISGLAAAYRLQRDAPQLNVALVEKNGRFGGKLQTMCKDGFTIELGPDCFLARKPRGVGLCEELGIADQLIGRNPNHRKTFVLRHGRLHRLPEGLTGMIPTDLDALANSTLLSENGRRAIAQEPTQPVHPAESGDESLADFVTRRFGREAFENLIEPLMGGIYAGQADRLSLAATFPQLRQLELKYGSLLKGLTAPKEERVAVPYPPFVSLPGGIGQLAEEVVKRLEGVRLLHGWSAAGLAQLDKSYKVILEDKSRQTVQTLHARHVILATPAFVSGVLLRDIDPLLAEALCRIPYASTALVNLAFDKSDLGVTLDGYGYVIPNAEGKDALACTWSSLKWDGRAPDDRLLLRVYIGRFGSDVTRYDDGRLQQIALDELRETLDINANPIHSHVQRWPQGLPQYNLGHTSLIQTIQGQIGQHPNLRLAGNYFTGVGIPDAIQSGEQAADGVMDSVQFWAKSGRG